MLLAEDKKKLESYVDKLIEGLKKDTAKAKSNGVSGDQLIEKVTNMTVSKLTPESKMILSSAYNMMKEHTLAEEYFADSANKAAFYSADILKELSQKYNFDVPNEINYEESDETVKKMCALGVIGIGGGGVISWITKSWIPITIGIAAILAAIMTYVIKNHGVASSGNSIDAVINEYYASVKKSLLAWVDSIDAYYDKAVAEIKERG
jgi:polysaccharide pyruvyl transferase WcaK-like protein